MNRELTRDEDSTIDRASSSPGTDVAVSLNAYRLELKRCRITPRQWLKANSSLPAHGEFRRQLWSCYSLAYPPPNVPGFTIEDVLGEGGMGLVYLGRDNLLNRQVAIKELTDELRRHAKFHTRFRREAQILAKLDHPNIVKVHQFIRHEAREFIAMEYMPDGSLVERMRLPVDADAAAWLVAKLARAIATAHADQIVHRDLKPGNILFDKNEEPKISDFGLAKDLLDASDLTQDAAVGTAHYMAPEQTEGKPPTAAVDIWALGVILYRLLTGRQPFEGKNQGDLFVNIRTKAPAEMGAAVPAELQAICLRCLHKNPGDRYRRAEDLASALEAKVPPAGSRRRPARRVARLLGWAALVAVVLLAVAVAFTLLFRRPTTDAPVVMKERHAGYCASIAFAADGLKAVSEDGGGEISIWDLKNGLKEKTLVHGMGQPQQQQETGGLVAVSADGSYFVAASLNPWPRNKYILGLYNQKTNELLDKAFASFPAAMTGGVAFSADGSKLAVAELPGMLGLVKPKLTIVEIPSGKTKPYLVAAPLQSLAFSADGKSLLGGAGDKTVCLWQTEGFIKKADFVGHDGAVDQVAFAADGKSIYSASSQDDTLRIWDNDKNVGAEVKQIALRKTAARMACAAFWPGGRAVTGHIDGSICLWDLDTGNVRYQQKHQDVSVTAIAIAPDGRGAVAAFSDHSVRYYRLPPPRP